MNYIYICKGHGQPGEACVTSDPGGVVDSAVTADGSESSTYLGAGHEDRFFRRLPWCMAGMVVHDDVCVCHVFGTCAIWLTCVRWW